MANKTGVRWIYYYDSNKITGKETGKTHLCSTRALEFIRDHVTFKLPYDFSYQMKTPKHLFRTSQNIKFIWNSILYLSCTALFDNLTIFQGIVVSVLYCFCSPDVRVVIAKRLYRMKVRWRSRNLRRDNNRRFRESRRVSYIFYNLKSDRKRKLQKLFQNFH